MYLHQPLAWVDSHHLDTAGVRGVLKAAAAVEMGLCEVAVVGSGRAGPFSADGTSPGANMNLEFAEPYGSFVMAQFAVVATRHMHEFGTTQEQIAGVSATIRNHGHVNPEAVMFGAGPYSAADVLASPLTLIGSISECAERLRERRERWGYSYSVIPGDKARDFAPLVAALTGT